MDGSWLNDNTLDVSWETLRDQRTNRKAPETVTWRKRKRPDGKTQTASYTRTRLRTLLSASQAPKIYSLNNSATKSMNNVRGNRTARHWTCIIQSKSTFNRPSCWYEVGLPGIKLAFKKKSIKSAWTIEQMWAKERKRLASTKHAQSDDQRFVTVCFQQLSAIRKSWSAGQIWLASVFWWLARSYPEEIAYKCFCRKSHFSYSFIQGTGL